MRRTEPRRGRTTAARELRIILLRRNLLASELAREIDCHPAHLSQVVNGHRRSDRIRDELVRRFGRRLGRLIDAASAESKTYEEQSSTGDSATPEVG
jgi:hypothetical protein